MYMRVGVVRGGANSPLLERSLKSGQTLLSALREMGRIPVDIFVDRNGNWNIDGLPVSPNSISQYIDFAFPYVYELGNDQNTVEHLLEKQNIPFPHPNQLWVACGAMPKTLYDVLRDVGVKIPIHLHTAYMETKDIARAVHNKFSPPYAVPRDEQIFNSLNELSQAIKDYDKNGNPLPTAFHEYISGSEWIVNVVPQFRGVPHYVLTPVPGNVWDKPFKIDWQAPTPHDSKLPLPLRDQLSFYGQLVSGSLGGNGPLQLHFRQNPVHGLVLTEVWTKPPIAQDSAFVKSLSESSSSLSEYLKFAMGE